MGREKQSNIYEEIMTLLIIELPVELAYLIIYMIETKNISIVYEMQIQK